MKTINIFLIILGVLIIAFVFYQNSKVEEKIPVSLYYYNSSLDQDETGNIMCSQKGIVEVKREMLKTITPIQDSIKLLLNGDLTEEEKALGISTEYPLDGFSLKGASLKDGDLTLEFNDFNNKTVGGSCRTAILWFQIRNTAMQFPEVKTVKFIPEELFQP
ncbi:MAG: GerMN domain-containing protein [Candidatus Pacebacteria bacterium]|nr:GerMN domain-containing protein [Candidatus Paceibacterota bacterium]